MSMPVNHAGSHPLQTADEDDNTDSDVSETSPVNAPTHLRQLFDDGPLDYAEVQSPWKTGQHSSRIEHRKERARTLLRRLLPPREKVASIAANTGPWLNIIRDMLFTPYGMESTATIVSRWDRVQDPDVSPIELAMLLITLATTIQQMPAETVTQIFSSLEAGYDFSQEVSDVVSTAIVNDDVLAASLEGLEVCCWWLRLQLLTSDEKTYLVLRRVIALGEMLGLPRVANGVSAYEARKSVLRSDLTPAQHRQAGGVALWTAICAADRLASLLFNFPLGTGHYQFLHCDPYQDGQVDPQTYLCRLADIATGIQAIDNLSAQGASPSEMCDKALHVDQQLRKLYGSVPRTWWEALPDRASPDGFLQQFHNYVIVRAHMQLALKNDAGTQFAYSELICMEACRELARLYTIVRRMLPSGFFASRVLDLQALTAAIVLLKKQHQAPSSAPAAGQETTATLIHRLLETMDLGASLPGGKIAQQGAHAIRAIAALLSDKHSTEDRSLTLRVPLLGRIDVHRKAPQPVQPAQEQVMQPSQYWPSPAPNPSANEAGINVNGQAFVQEIDPMAWSLEISELPPFFSDDAYGQDPWFSFGIPNVGIEGLGGS
ncbi:hypothetical protein LTR86_000599 [Recurvomyces mirabilis]|nr:hypothetical protein LTR86_000599 [Recurvomyces mirabilis]